MAQSPIPSLSLRDLQDAVTGAAAAFRCVAKYEPAGGTGDKVFPPTYEKGEYATEPRLIGGEPVPCVLLDSVQSQANRMEQALLDAWERKRIVLPIITVDFTKCDLPRPMRITSLEAPHRIADALLRDSLLDGKAFRKSKTGEKLDRISNRDATGLFELCPTALVFGMWDSTGPHGGLGAKFPRALVSEIVGIRCQEGNKTSSRIDPTQIMLAAGPLYRAKEGEITWTLDEKAAVRRQEGTRQARQRRQALRSQPRQRDAHNHHGRRDDRGGRADDRALPAGPSSAPISTAGQEYVAARSGRRGSHRARSARSLCRSLEPGPRLRPALALPVTPDGTLCLGSARQARRNAEEVLVIARRSCGHIQRGRRACQEGRSSLDGSGVGPHALAATG